MAGIYDELDLHWSWNGDILPSAKGDILDTSSDTIQSLRDQVSLICASAFGDWAIYPSKGASLDDFIGEPNIPETADTISDRVRLALTSTGLVDEADLEINVIPVQLHKLLIVIRIDAIATTTNSLDPNEVLVVAIAYDTQENNLFFVNPQEN
jgi:hypothetical protein